MRSVRDPIHIQVRPVAVCPKNTAVTTTLTGRVPLVLVLLTHHRRRIVHPAITEHPTAVWTAQQIIDAFPDDTAPRWLLRDRDAIYGDVFRRRVRTAAAAPWTVTKPSRVPTT